MSSRGGSGFLVPVFFWERGWMLFPASTSRLEGLAAPPGCSEVYPTGKQGRGAGLG